jgi:hypothetical protein
VDPQGSLAEVLARIVNDHLDSQIDELLLWANVQSEGLRNLGSQERWLIVSNGDRVVF